MDLPEQALEAMGGAFERSVKALSQELQQACATEIGRVREQLKNVRSVGSDRQGLGRAHIKLQAAFLAYREAVLAVRGPTSSPGLNLILHSLDRALRGELPRALLAARLAQESRAFSAQQEVQHALLRLLHRAEEGSEEELSRLRDQLLEAVGPGSANSP